MKLPTKPGSVAAGVVLDVLANYETCELETLWEKCSYILMDLQRLAACIDA